VKRFSVFLAALVIILAFGLAFVSCDDGSTGGGGSTSLPGTSWKNDIYTLNFIDSSNWSLDGYADNCASGYYSVSGNTVTVTCTYENTSIYNGVIEQGETGKLQFQDSKTLKDERGRSWVKK
jgi:hypothetical protein